METKQIPNCHNCGKPLRRLREVMGNTREWEWNEKTKKYVLVDEDYADCSDLICEECSNFLSSEERSFFFDNYKFPTQPE
jgi:hypothetical protein